MGQRTVLVVEDSEVEAQLLERALRNSISHSSIVVVHNTLAAEQYLYSGGTQPTPDLLVLDVKVPPSGGLELLKKVRADSRTKGVPVLMLSGQMGDEDVQKLYLSGANSYLDKPVDSQQFSSMVSAAAHYWLGLNRSAPR